MPWPWQRDVRGSLSLSDQPQQFSGIWDSWLSPKQLCQCRICWWSPLPKSQRWPKVSHGDLLAPSLLGCTHWGPPHRDVSSRQWASSRRSTEAGRSARGKTTPNSPELMVLFCPLSFLLFSSLIPYLFSLLSHQRAGTFWVQIPVPLVINHVAVRILLSLSMSQLFFFF